MEHVARRYHRRLHRRFLLDPWFPHLLPSRHSRAHTVSDSNLNCYDHTPDRETNLRRWTNAVGHKVRFDSQGRYYHGKVLSVSTMGYLATIQLHSSCPYPSRASTDGVCTFDLCNSYISCVEYEFKYFKRGIQMTQIKPDVNLETEICAMRARLDELEKDILGSYTTLSSRYWVSDYKTERAYIIGSDVWRWDFNSSLWTCRTLVKTNTEIETRKDAKPILIVHGI